MKAENNKNIQLIAFFAMVAMITLLCIFLYFGGNEMEKLQKGFAIGSIVLIAICASLCIAFAKPVEKKIEGSEIIIVRTRKKDSKTLRIQCFDSLADMMNGNASTTKICILSDVNTSKEIFDLCKDEAYNVSIETSGKTVTVKVKAD